VFILRTVYKTVMYCRVIGYGNSVPAPI